MLGKIKKLINKVCPGEWNSHLAEDIFGEKPRNPKAVLKDICTWQGAYEHKDEHGNWVPGPALGHGSEPGYSVNDSWFGKFFKEHTGENLVDF